jgi:hypothetical protein
MVIVEAYKPCKYIGYVVEDSNIIHIDNKFIYDDLEKMSKRNNDWNFCALHEMGHMFDNHRPWNFETEMMTDLKLAYCIDMGGGSVAPSEFAAKDYFYFDTIMDCYAELGGDMNQSKKYGAYQAAYVMLRIQKAIGWEPFKQTYKWFMETGTNPATKYEKFFLFVDKLSEYSDKDVEKMFSSIEWATFCENYGYQG